MRGVWINLVRQKRKFDRVCRTFFEINLGSTHGAPSESDVAPVSPQSWTYSIRFGIWKVRRLNLAILSEEKKYNTAKKFSGSAYSSYKICIPIFFYNIRQNDHKKKN